MVNNLLEKIKKDLLDGDFVSRHDAYKLFARTFKPGFKDKQKVWDKLEEIEYIRYEESIKGDLIPVWEEEY